MSANLKDNEIRKGKARGFLKKNPTSQRTFPVRTYLTQDEKFKLEKIAAEEERDLSSFLRIILKRADCI